MQRKVPTFPEKDQRIPLIIDTDAANEIDDLYAIAFAVLSKNRFDIKGFVATHFAQKGGKESIQQSYETIQTLQQVLGCNYRVECGGDPLCYPATPSQSDGANFIIECAQKATEENPLWVLGLGAATNLASALLLQPEIATKVVYLFHGRSEDTWPVRTKQFNVYGDTIAAKTLLESNVPLIWFDTGTSLNASMQETEEKLKPLGEIGAYLHQYRYQCDYFQQSDKGFFDVGDIAWLIDPSVCQCEVIQAPTLNRWLYFDFERTHGEILYVSQIKAQPTWELFYQTLQQSAENNI